MHVRKCHTMDWNNFDEYFGKLKTVLRNIIGNGKNANKLEIYGSYLDYRGDISTIIQRIEAETQEYMILRRRIAEMIQRNEEPDKELFMKIDKIFISLRLDIKSFFIFTRIFLDTLARIIRLYFGKKGGQLPWDMAELVKHKKLIELDSDFAEGLKDRMFWMDSLRTRRVEIEHYLGSIRSITTRDGKFGFDLLGARIRRDWGTDTVMSITDYMEDTLSNLSSVILHIYHKFQLQDT